MPTAKDLHRIAALATDAAQRMSQTGDPLPVAPAGLGVLLAEMQALLQVLPGQTAPMIDPRPPVGLTDAEIEAGFDNMPV